MSILMLPAVKSVSWILARKRPVPDPSWDGKGSDGAQAADGNYRVSVSALRGDQKIDAQTLASATVQGVVQGDQGVRLNVGALGLVGLPDIKQIF